MLELLEEDGLLEVFGENKNSLSEDVEEALRHADDAEVRVEGSEDELEVVIESCPFEEAVSSLIGIKCL